MREYKSCGDSRLKAEEPQGGDGGTVTGYASTWERVPDSYGDVVARGAFARSLERWEALNAEGRYIPLLYGHDTQDPMHNIGRVVAAQEDDYGLLVTAELDADNPLAQYARKLVAEGRLYQFSFAFDITASERVKVDGAEARELTGVELYEVSLVQIPANQTATVQEVKQRPKEEPMNDTKEGRRNSKADLDGLRTAMALRDEAADALGEALAEGAEDWRENVSDAVSALDKLSETLAALIGADEEDGTDATDEGEGDASPKGPGSQDGGDELAKAKMTTIKGALTALGKE